MVHACTWMSCPYSLLIILVNFGSCCFEPHGSSWNGMTIVIEAYDKHHDHEFTSCIPSKRSSSFLSKSDWVFLLFLIFKTHSSLAMGSSSYVWKYLCLRCLLLATPRRHLRLCLRLWTTKLLQSPTGQGCHWAPNHLTIALLGIRVTFRRLS